MISTKNLTPVSPSVRYCETIRDVHREVLDDHHEAVTSWRIVGAKIDDLSAQILFAEDVSEQQRLGDEQTAARKDYEKIASKLAGIRNRMKEVQTTISFPAAAVLADRCS